MAPRAYLLCVYFIVGFLANNILAAYIEIGLNFTVEPSDVIVTRNKPVTLECGATSTVGDVTFSWTRRNGAVVHPVADTTGRYEVYDNGTLLVKKVTPSTIRFPDGDDGVYRCHATTMTTTTANGVVTLVSRPATLSVATLSHDFTEYPSANQTRLVGSTIRLACQIKSVPNALISWEKDKIPLPPNSRYILVSTGVLFITAAENADAGSYRCVASNPLTKKQRSSPEGQLSIINTSSTSSTVPDDNVITKNATQYTSIRTEIGGNFTLDCNSTSFATTLRWHHVSPIVNQTVSVPGLSVLFVNDVKLYHYGIYTCTGTNGKDTANVKVVNVTVRVAPIIAKKPISQVYPTAKTVRFDCQVDGIPSPDVVWLKNGAPLQINGRIKQRPTELVLSNTVTDDSGVYQCIATNEVGQVSAAGRLLINASKFQPDPPHSLSCSVLSATQLQLTWEQGDGKQSETDIKAYTIHYLPSAGGEERQEVSVNKTRLIEKLQAFTNYTLYARSYSGRSASDQSERIVCQTGEGVPQGVPALALDATSPTTLRVTWQALTSDKARGVVTEYKVQWRRSGSPSTNVEQLGGDMLDYTITGLHPGKKYEVRVVPATSEGWPEVADEHLAWTSTEMPAHQDNGGLPPPELQATIINASVVEVSWVWPQLGNELQELTGVKLSYRKQNNPNDVVVLLEANATQHLLTGLDPNEWYEIQVSGWNAGSEGKYAVKSVRTASVAPVLAHLEAPGGLDAAPTTSTAINLTWVPAAHEANISYYMICYSPVRSNSPSYINSSSPGVEITNLKPYTQYKFKVRSHDYQRRHGPYSQTIECHTKEDIPGVVLDLQWKALNTTYARVVWSAPDKTNGPIGAYVVTLSADLNAPPEKWRSQRVVPAKTSTDLALQPNVRYYLLVRAETKAGLGPPSALMSLIIPVISKTLALPPATEQPQTDRHQGIMVGVGIGAVCVLVCIGVALWRRRCNRSSVPVESTNGNGCCRDRRTVAALASQDIHELELLSDTGTHIQTVHIPPGNYAHCDTKGPGRYPNGQANGLLNGRIPNGHSARDRNSLHITENPQCGQGNGEQQAPLLLDSKLETMVDQFADDNEEDERDNTRLTTLETSQATLPPPPH